MAIGKSSVNKVIILGNVGQDIEIKKTSNGVPVATLSVATTQLWKNQEGSSNERTEWHRVVAWGKLAELAAKWLRKGSKVFIEGSLRTRSFNDKKGTKRFVTEIIAQSLTFLDPKIEDDELVDSETIDEGDLPS